MDTHSFDYTSSNSPLHFLLEWNDTQCADWLLEGLATGQFKYLKYSSRLHPIASSYLFQLFLDSPVSHQNILRRGVVRSIRYWQKHHGIQILQELIFLVIYTRAIDAIGELKSFFLSVEDEDEQRLYKLRGDILYAMRSLTSIGDEVIYRFFLKLINNPLDFRYVKQTILGVIESRPINISISTICDYVDLFFAHASQQPEFFDDYSIEDFSVALADTLDALALLEVLGISKRRKNSIAWHVGAYILATPKSSLSIKYVRGAAHQIIGKDGATLPVPQWFSGSDLDRDIQRKAANYESMMYKSNTVSLLSEQLHGPFS